MAKDEGSLLSLRWQQFLKRLLVALRREGLALWAGLRDPALWALLLLTLLLVALAGQAAPSFSLNVGQRPDDLYLDGFHEGEQKSGQTYRWSTGEGRLHVPGLRQAPYRLEILLAAWRPPNVSAPHLRLETLGRPLLETSVGPDPRWYVVLLPAEALRGGELDLVLQSETFTTTKDPRQLGVMLDQILLRPAGWSPAIPSGDALLWTALVVLLSVLLARRLGWSRWIALGAGAALALALAAVLAWAGPLLLPGLALLPLGLACAWAAVALLQGAVGSLFAWAGAALDPRTERALWSAVAFFLAVRLAGSLHPALQAWDLCFHLHKMELVMQGQLLFTIESGEWRGLDTLYLPSPYLLIAPFWTLFGGRLIPFKVFNVLLDTLAALLVAYIARRLLGRGHTTWLAGLLYLAMPLSYIIFSWGVVANIFGQWLLLLVLALLVSPAGRLASGRTWLAATGLLVLAMLSHPGTVLLTGFLLVACLATLLLAPLPALSRRMAGRWVLAGLVAVALAVLLYYSHFAETMWASIQAMLGGANVVRPAHGGFVVRGPVRDPDLGLRAVEVATSWEAALAGVQELAAEARAYFHTLPLVLALAALLGWMRERRALAVRLTGLALVVALLFAIVGLALNLYVRYMYFLLPFVAIGVAWWLDRLSRRALAGRLVVGLAGLYLLFTGLAFWANHVLYYGTGCH